MTTDTAYDKREIQSHYVNIDATESAPLWDRQAARDEWLHDMRTDPQLIADRIGWLLGGNYGYGSYLISRQIADNKRLNREAALSQMIAALEWRCPARFAARAWNKLTPDQQQELSKRIQTELDDYEIERNAETEADSE